MNDPLANAFSAIYNAEKISKDCCEIKPSSKLIKKILEKLNENNLIGSYEEISSARGGVLKIYLLGRINRCGVIKPRFNVQIKNIEKFEKRFLPSKDFGVLILSTSKGILTNKEAKEKKIGGKLLCFCY